MNKIILTLIISAFFTNLTFAQSGPCSAVNIAPFFGPLSAPCSGGGSAAVAITPVAVDAADVSNTVSGTTGVTNAGGTCIIPLTIATTQDYWYSYTVPANGGNFVINVSSAGGGLTNPEIQWYTSTGACSSSNLALTYVGCSAAAPATTGTITPTAGTTYYFRIYDDGNAMDKFTLCARTSPTNDLCTNAVPLTSGTTICGGTAGGVLNGASSTGGCSTDTDVWYRFTTGNPANCYSWQESAIVTPSGCTDNVLAIYTGCGVTGTGTGFIGYNFTGNSFNDMSTADLSTALLPNTTYYIQVAADVAQTFCLKYTANTPIAANDNCTAPLSIGTSPVATDNAVAGCEYTYVAAQDANITPASICAGSLENVSWFSFTTQATPATSNVTISFSNITCNNGGGGFQTGLFTGVCPTLTATGSCVAAASGTVNYTINNSPAGTVYYIAMDGNAGSNCHFSVSGINIVPLPIELLSFNAEAFSSGYVQLNWKTISETNNDYFSIERSADGLNFELMGIVDGAGNSNQILDYSTRDLNPLSGTGYYRLKQTDYDGNSTYSSISKVDFNEADELYFNIYPNPTSEGSNPILSLTGNEEEEMIVNIYEMTGKLISSTKVILNSNGVTNVEMKTNLSQGIYLISATNSKNITQVKKFVVE